MLAWLLIPGSLTVTGDLIAAGSGVEVEAEDIELEEDEGTVVEDVELEEDEGTVAGGAACEEDEGAAVGDVELEEDEGKVSGVEEIPVEVFAGAGPNEV